MTNDQFRDCFVGEKGFESLKKLMKNGYDLLTDLSKCLQDRSDLELSYAKALRKNSEALQKLANRATGSLTQALTQIGTQTSVESDVHHTFGSDILNKISVPMKNLAETQLKARKPLEENVLTSLKAWKERRSVDMKYRQRHFEICREIESYYLKMDEIPKLQKNAAKESSKDIPLATSCIYMNGRQISITPEKIESSLKKLESELEKTEKKYHEATKQVEAGRQSFDIEMCRGCDLLQSMEMNRICEIQKFIDTFVNSMRNVSVTTSQVEHELSSIMITPQDDIVTEGKLNIQSTESEILLYDILAEAEPNTMSQERRILSLMNWMKMLKQDIEVQRRSKDGIENLQGFCQQNQNFSAAVNANDIYTNQQRVRLLQCLYEASLYKMEKVYNRIKRLAEPHSQYEDSFAKTYGEKNTPTTYLRIPFQPLTQVSPQAPSPMLHLARSTPILGMQPPSNTSGISYGGAVAPSPYPVLDNQPQIGWSVNDMTSSQTSADNVMAASSCPYPVLPKNSPVVESVRSMNTNRVRVLFSYDREHDDELTIRPGDIINLIERRSDNWCKGELRGRIGLFPGNFVEDI